MTESLASLRLPGIFSHHMVLQADRVNVIWGWGRPGRSITVSFRGDISSGRVNDDGRWRLDLAASPASSMREVIVVTSGDETRLISDVLIGDVWLCSGQSNMGWMVAQSKNAELETERANHPEIRLFKVPKCATPWTADDTKAQWWVCRPNTVGEFSGVGYFFGREIHEERKVPIGLVDCSWGGTTAEAWTEWNFLRGQPGLKDLVTAREAVFGVSESETRVRVDLLRKWRNSDQSVNTSECAGFQTWSEVGINDSEWRQFETPGAWQQQGILHNGAVWFRKTVVIPENWNYCDSVLSLGILSDSDETYFNGVKVGATGQELPDRWRHSRHYLVPGSLLRPGQKNTIAVRIFDSLGQGGFFGGGPIRLHLQHDVSVGLALDGPWVAKVERIVESEVPPEIESLIGSNGLFHQGSPGTLFNGMIAPLGPFGLRGVIWYQGESNEHRPEQYKIIFPCLIESWRRHFENLSLPFHFVLLANVNSLQTRPVEEGWAAIREAQLCGLSLPHTGMASAIDLGEANDVHPRDKQSVGHRLALSVRALVYGEKIEYSGPELVKAERDGRRVRLAFRHIASGLMTSDRGPLKGFAIKGQQGAWIWAEAEIEKNSVLVWSKSLREIDGVCYAWANNPVGNLVNGAALPASPFKIDGLVSTTDQSDNGGTQEADSAA